MKVKLIDPIVVYDGSAVAAIFSNPIDGKLWIGMLDPMHEPGSESWDSIEVSQDQISELKEIRDFGLLVDRLIQFMDHDESNKWIIIPTLSELEKDEYFVMKLNI
jgi:hypothetical protein